MISNIKNGKKIPLDHNAWLLQEDDYLTVIRLDIDEEHTLEAHINPEKVVFYVLDGKGACNVDRENYILEKGDMIEVAAGRERSWRNLGSQVLELMVIKYKIS